MKVIKNINNNVALCTDSSGKTVVAFGKGVGFRKAPYEIELSEIERTYYDVDPHYVEMISEIPDEIMTIANDIINYARAKIDKEIGSNVVFTLADHIKFCVERFKKGMNISLPILYDIQNLYEKEMDIGEQTLKLIKKRLKVVLPREEAAYIALHIINAEAMSNGVKDKYTDEKIIDDITGIIERNYGIEIKRNGFNYSRFASHMYYLLKRSKENALLNTNNESMYEQIKKEYPNADASVQLVATYLNESIGLNITDEERFYLIVHINRLTSREDNVNNNNA